MLIDNKYDIGQTVFLHTDNEQLERIVTEFNVTKGDILYKVCLGDRCTWHYSFEISETMNLEKKL